MHLYKGRKIIAQGDYAISRREKLQKKALRLYRLGEIRQWNWKHIQIARNYCYTMDGDMELLEAMHKKYADMI